MKNYKIATLFPLLFIILFLNNAQAQKWNKNNKNDRPITKDNKHNDNKPDRVVGNWYVLGTLTANLSRDHDVLVVGGNRDYFSKLKFRVSNAPVTIRRMVVRYHSGAPETIETRSQIPQGGESRIIDLRGGTRKIKTIEFWYDTKGIFKGKAKVTVFGRR